MQQLLVAEQADVVLSASIRVVTGTIKFGAVDRDRPGDVITLSADGDRPRQVTRPVSGPVNQVVFYAAEDNTVFDLWSASLTAQTAAPAGDAHGPPTDNWLTRLVAIAVPDPNARATIQAELAAPLASLDSIAAALQDRPGRGQDADAVRFIGDLVPITGDDEALIATLIARRRSKELVNAATLATYSPRQWTALLDAAHPTADPAGHPAVVKRLAAAAQAAYPGRALMAAARADAASSLNRPDVLAFFDTHPDVDLVTTPLRSVRALAENPTLRSELEKLQRLARVTPVHNHVDQLNKAGYRSASAIARTGRSAFVTAHARTLGGPAAAKAVYEKAAMTSTRAFALYARYSPTFNRQLPRVLTPATDGAQDQIPDWRELFGDQLNLVTDDPSRTVFSPAAYLTDLLSFLDHQKPASDAFPQSGLDALAQTRPDLLQLALDDTNTMVELPMLDLVNELLECAVLAEDPTSRQPWWCTSAPPDGTADTQVGPWTTATVTADDPAPWAETGTAYHQTTAAADYHAHGFAVTGGATGLALAPGDMIGLWVRPKADTPPGPIVVTVSVAAGRHQLLWGYPAYDATWTPETTAMQVGPLPPLARWTLLTVNADTIGIDTLAVTGLEFGCVSGAADWGPAGSYPAAPPTTTADDSLRRRNQPQLVRDQAYDAIADDVYPWSTTPLDLGYHTARLASQALGVDLAEMVAALTCANRVDELTDIRVATTMLGIGPGLHKVLLGIDGATEEAHWGPFAADGGDWFQDQLSRAETFLPRAGLTAAQMRTPPGAANSYSFALDPIVIDQTTGATDLLVIGLSEFSLPYLRRFLRLWQVFGGDHGPLERFYDALADRDPVGNWPVVGDVLLTNLALAQRLLDRMDTDLVTIASWWTPLLDDAALNVDPASYPDDGPSSAASSPYRRTFLNPDLGDTARVFALTGDEITDQIPLPEAIPAIAAALGANAADLTLLIASAWSGITPLPTGATLLLTRQAVSAIHRAVTFTQAAALSMADYLSLRELTGLDPFDPAAPATTLLFLEAADDVSSAGVSVAELDYLLAGTRRPGTDFSAGPPADLVTTLVNGLTQLRQIHQVVPDPNGDVVRRELIAAQCPESPDDVLAAVDGAGNYATPLAADPRLTADDLALLMVWQEGELSSGVLSAADRDAVLGRHADSAVQAAVQSLFQAPRTVLMAVPGLNTATITAVLEGHAPVAQRHLSVLAAVVPAVVRTLGTTLIVTALATRTLLDTTIVDQVLTTMTDSTGTPAGMTLLDLSTASTPADLNAAADLVARIDKMARICALGHLNPTQTRFVLTQAGATGWLDLLNLPPAHGVAVDFAGWQRLRRYLAIRNRIGDWNDTLLSIFAAALNPPADLGAAQAQAFTTLSALTGWEMGTLTDLHRLLGLTYPGDYRDERSLLRLERAIAAIRSLGAEATRVAEWSTTLGETATGSDILAFAHAATRATPDALQPIEDSLRRLRRNALVNHLFPSTTSVPPGDSALAHFLIDTEVDVNRSTTRIAAATQSVQLFVQRSLLDLDTQVDLTHDARQEWSWLDGYTSWSAARQLFLYPENVITPDARLDLTPTFEDLQTKLQQGDLTADNAETALVGYLHALDAFAQLQGVALYEEQVDSTEPAKTVLHLVARTQSNPHQYYYRQRGPDGLWAAWEDIGVDIDSENVSAFVLDRQLHVFWLHTIDHVEQLKTVPAQPTAGAAAPQPDTQLRLAWTVRTSNGWSSKKLSTDTVEISISAPDHLAMDIKWTGYSPSTPSLPVIIRWYTPGPRDDLGPSRESQIYGQFTFSADSQSVTATQGDGHIENIAPPLSWVMSPVPSLWRQAAVNYQSWITDVMLYFEVPSGLQGISRGLGAARLLGARSSGQASTGYESAVDPTLPFFLEPTGYSLLFRPDPRSATLEYFAELAYHPYVKPYLRTITLLGLPGLFDRSAQIRPEALAADRTPLNFAALNILAGVVLNPDLSETLDFDSGGYFSAYNWELFFHAPRLIARQLTASQRFAEAKTWLEYVFDPLDRSADPSPAKYWQTKPLYQAVEESIADLLNALDGQPNSAAEIQVALWRANPFDPDVIAVLRPEAYQKATVMAYLDNLIAWGDSQFAQATPESLATATQLYLFASDLLGPAPQPGPTPGPTAPEPRPECFASLRHRLDSFSDAVVALENRMAVWTTYPDGPPGYDPAPSAVLPPALYFSVPPNPTLLAYWSTVADRLNKLREGENLAGQPLQLAPYPVIGNPANYLSGGSAGGISSKVSRPVYRFNTLIAKAQELCGDVRNLGSALLSALEKQDAETLAALRATQELAVLRKARAVKESALTEAGQQITQLQAALAVTTNRFEYYKGRKQYNQQELAQVAHLQTSSVLQARATGLEALATAFNFLPEATIGFGGVGPVVTATLGGRELSEAASLAARLVSRASGIESHLANMASLSGGWARRWDDWQFQVGQAQLEMVQISAQINAATTRQQQAQQDLDNHDLQITNATQVQTFLHSKYTNAELYSWMVSQTSAVYANVYRLALVAARRAEDAFRWELLPDPSIFIQPNYWNSQRSGLLAGEHLSYDLRQMETAFLERNARKFEITKHISLAMADPLSLVQLRTTGNCTLTIPESWFDLDYPGHYLRRIKRVSISIPCVTGPYTGVHCSLSLQTDKTRIDPSLSAGTTWARSGQTDPRFVDRYGLTEAIVTSGGLDQSGTFSAGGDDRFDPFEGSGAESTWLINLPTETNTFARESITDVILHVSYTARDAGTAARDAATTEVVTPMRQIGTVLLTAGQNFPQQWQQILSSAADPRILSLPLTLDLLPTTAATTSVVKRLRIYLETASSGQIAVEVTPPGGAATSVDLRPDESLPGLLAAVLDLTAPPARPGALGNWTMQWTAATFTAAAPADMLILVDYEPAAAAARAARSVTSKRKQRSLAKTPLPSPDESLPAPTAEGPTPHRADE